jgi:ribosomal subunit interface protein
MEVVVRGRQIEVSDRFREHINERLGRLAHHGFTLQRIDVEVTKERNPRLADQAIRVELTCLARGDIIRAEYAAGDKVVAFDVAADRLDERLKRSAERRRHRARGNGRPHPAPVPRVEPAAPADEVEADEPAEPGVIFADGPVVVREKTHATQAMSVEQALDAMELVGHDFYLFLDAENGKPSVVYRRRGYDYGLIRLEVASISAVS